MVNSDIGNISIITNSNYLSLMDHIGSGKDWDLARRNGGIKMLPPNVTPYGYHGREESVSRLAALKNVNLTISRITDDYIVLSDCDMICNIDLNDIIKQHIAENANITIAVKSLDLMPDTAKHNTIVISDENGLVRDILTYPNHFSGVAEVSLNILVMSTAYLQQIVQGFNCIQLFKFDEGYYFAVSETRLRTREYSCLSLRRVLCGSYFSFRIF